MEHIVLTGHPLVCLLMNESHGKPVKCLFFPPSPAKAEEKKEEKKEESEESDDDMGFGLFD